MNEYIKDYCKEFITSKHVPQFAILVKGSWGVGKTFFINSLIDELKDNKECKLLKISLFGVKRAEDIDLKIYEAFHPLLSSNGAKIAGALLRSAVQLGTDVKIGGKNIGLGFDLSDVDNLSQQKNKRYDKKQKNIVTTIFVDDIERALMSTEEVFGYFSDYITDSFVRIVFIGNEKKVTNGDNYKDIKEKTIGMEFTIEPDYANAIDSFMQELSFSEQESRIVAEILQQIITVEQCDNLRVIRQSLYGLKLFSKSIEDFSEEYKKECISSFILLSILKGLNVFKEEDIKSAFVSFYTKKISLQQYYNENKKHKDDPFWDLYSNFAFQSILSNNTWVEIIFNGKIDEVSLKKEYETKLETMKQEEQKKLFVFMSSWYNIESTPEQFKKTIEDLKNEFNSGIYDHPGEVLHYALTMLYLSEEEIIPDSNQDIINQVQTFIDEHQIQTISNDDWNAMMAMGYGNYSFRDIVNDNQKHICSIIKNTCTKQFVSSLQSSLNDSVNQLGNKISATEFCKSIYGNPKVENIPILSLIDIDVFFSRIADLPIKDISLIIEYFEDRYGKKYNSSLKKDYFPDYEGLKKLSHLFEVKSKNETNLYNPRAKWIKTFSNRLTDLLVYFEKQQEDK